ncbi:nadh:flavin oxidoreductase [Stylonychia lemnae]|uniref:Nadh:flavin oxidoreductase n=1 Tax=Stylonychia lemnae TaxID=5949 RepID=A0A078B285_STYLE|nr:nadh:flavin oxidoreductase [Stylonychia lemnae]|eukprot:CDW87558.1 nadh:flavin oxidoreductase [Stylonychia lemnae]
MVDQTHPVLTSFKLGDLELPNRLVVAAMTRCRADPAAGIPNDLHVEYYSARASAGFILTECASVSQESNAFPGAANLYNDEQVVGWKRVVDAVHAKGGRIFAQIYHGGRAVHPDMIGGGVTYSSSAIAINGTVHTQNGRVPHAVPKEASAEDIKKVLNDFKRSAELAKQAGFDGIEIHGANGYLVDEFLRDSVNKRTDDYGGSIENRARLLVEILEQVKTVYPADRVGVKLSPFSSYNDIQDSDPIALYTHVVHAIGSIGFVEISELFSFDATNAELQSKFFANLEHQSIRPYLKPRFQGLAFISNGGYDLQKSNDVISSGESDLVSYAQLYLTNNDLPEKFAAGTPLNGLHNVKEMSKLWSVYFYGSTGEGYTDLSVYEP